MKFRGKIINISGKSGFIQIPGSRSIIFDLDDFNFQVDDLVEYNLQENIDPVNGNIFKKAVDLQLLIRNQDVSRVQIRLSRVAKDLNLSIGKIVSILDQHNIKVEANPNAKITNEQFSIILNRLEGNDVNDLTQSKINQLEGKYEKGNEIEVKISHIISPSQIVSILDDGFYGRLALIDLDWSMPIAEEKFRSFKVGDTLKCKIIDVDLINKQIKLSQKHLSAHLSDNIQWNRLERGDVLNASLIEELASSYIIKTDKGHYGILSKQYYNIIDGQTLKIKIQEKLDEIDLLRVLPASLEIKEEAPNTISLTNDFGFIEPDLRDYSSFKKSIIGTQASDKDVELLQRFFLDNPNLFSKEIEIEQVWNINFELNSSVYESIFKQNAIPYFLKNETYNIDNENKVLDILSKEIYWVRINFKEGKDEKIDFSLFNENVNLFGEVIISKNRKTYKCVIRNLSFGHTFGRATDEKKKNSKYGSFLFRSPLKISGPLTSVLSGESNKTVVDFITSKSKAFEIIRKLKLETGEILRQEGRTLGLIDKFLEYQESLLDQTKSQSIFISEFERINTDIGKLAIKVNQNISDSLEFENEVAVIIRIKSGKDSDSELLWFTDAQLQQCSEYCKIIFYREISLQNLQGGFYLELKVSKAQLQIQRTIIQDFLQKKIKIDHIESLLIQPDKIAPPIVSSVPLINPDLARTEQNKPDNNQIKAVRKAIGNNNIFLIQGPPGTGKTTVIAEIIEQLVKKGERILVTGQNHIAVDNVLSKISKNPSLNLLRVAKEDKIDKTLSQFHIDNLVKLYQGVFNIFLKNQVKLIKLYLELLELNRTKDEIFQEFNIKVNQYSLDYNELSTVLKHKHYQLRDAILSMHKHELLATISAFETWINSINNEIDLLIKPLIYNSVDVVFATCIGIKTDVVFKESDLRFDTVIIDEAGKANIAETLVAIELGKKVILVGDQMQLPPYMDSALIDPNDPKSFPKSEYGFGYLQDEIAKALKTSFFEFLINRINKNQFPGENLEMLNYQHRMHPNIGRFVSESFYGGKVLMGDKTIENRLLYPSPFDKEVVFFDTSNMENPYEQIQNSSAKNNCEAESISEYILPKLFENQLSPNEIAIIAPYKSQVANIKNYINSSNLCQHKNIDVSTLDSFQGKEYDVILFSFTRSSNHELSIKTGKRPIKVGFLDDAKRLNVAFSRAKKKLILIGNSKTLTDKKSHFDLLFNYTELFSKLVRLSKEESIGNFVNIANVSEFKSPFDLFNEKYKIGDAAVAKFKFLGKSSGKVFGYFFHIDGFVCLLPISLVDKIDRPNFEKFTTDNELKVTILDINNESKKVTIKAYNETPAIIKSNIQKKPNIWEINISQIKKGQQIEGRVIKKIEIGYLVEIDNGLQGLLHITKIRRGSKIAVGDLINVSVLAIKHQKKRISFGYL